MERLPVHVADDDFEALPTGGDSETFGHDPKLTSRAGGVCCTPTTRQGECCAPKSELAVDAPCCGPSSSSL
jgi:hypothetical protein